MTYSIKSDKQGASRRVLPVVLAVGIACIVSLSWISWRYYQQQLEPVSTDTQAVLFEIEAGAAPQSIADQLEDAGLIRASWAFSWYLRSEGIRGDIKAGTFSLEPRLSSQEIAAIITRPDDTSSLITIPPERRIDEIKTILINAGFDPEAVDEALDPAAHADHPALVDKPASASLEGYLYPETFQIDQGTTAIEVVQLSLNEMANRLTPDFKEAVAQQGLSVHEAITLASVVEREVTADNPQDRPQVAQVFYRRLAEEMRLESDITAYYGAALAGLNPRDHPGYHSPYNTYQNDGLPPGPISNVSDSSLEAVAQPAQTNYLYFVSGDPDENGISTTHFSSTLDEHRRLTQLYCTEQCGLPTR